MAETKEQKPVTEIWTLEDIVPVKKESQQVNDDFRDLGVVEPRYKFDDLLYFADVNVWHKRCVVKKASLVAGLGWKLTTDDSNKEPDEAYNKIIALLKHPNNNYNDSFIQILLRYLQDYFYLGNGWLEIVRNNLGEVAEIYHIPGRTVRRKEKFKGWWQVRTFTKVEFDNYNPDAVTDRNQLLHIYSYDALDEYYGCPEWLPAIAAMALDRSAVEYNTYLFENSMLAKFAIVIEGGSLSKTARSHLKKFLQENAKGLKNSGKALIISNDDPNVKIRFEKLHIDFKDRDMSFVTMRTFSRDEVITAHDMPPRLVGVVVGGQLGGSGETSGQLKIFKETTISPEQEKLEELLNKTIIASFGDHKWYLELNEMDISDPLAKAEQYSILQNIPEPVFDTDEIRIEYGYQPRTEKPQVISGEKMAKALSLIRKELEQAGEIEQDG